MPKKRFEGSTVLIRGFAVWGRRRGTDGKVYPTLTTARDAVLRDQLEVRRTRSSHSPTSDRTIYLLGADGEIYRFVHDEKPYRINLYKRQPRRVSFAFEEF